MAKESVALLKGKIDVAVVLDQLNAALSEEWMAYYQYWTAAQIVVGPQRAEIQKEFLDMLMKKLNHAKLDMRPYYRIGRSSCTNSARVV